VGYIYRKHFFYFKLKGTSGQYTDLRSDSMSSSLLPRRGRQPYPLPLFAIIDNLDLKLLDGMAQLVGVAVV
jgi:hypothetical protein